MFHIFLDNLNLDGHLNCFIGSKVTAILVNGGILPMGGVAVGRVCTCSLHSSLVFVIFFKKLHEKNVMVIVLLSALGERFSLLRVGVGGGGWLSTYFNVQYNYLERSLVGAIYLIVFSKSLAFVNSDNHFFSSIVVVSFFKGGPGHQDLP